MEIFAIQFVPITPLILSLGNNKKSGSAFLLLHIKYLKMLRFVPESSLLKAKWSQPYSACTVTHV